MSRNFGIMSGRTASGGFDDRSPATRSSYALRDSILLSTYAPLPRSKFTQAVLDVLCICAWVCLGLLGAAIVGGPVIVVMWMLFFS